jgi:peptidoglycan-associated lipoprotein
VINQFTAEPSSIERGQSATLRWSVANTTDISIDPSVGAVQANGSRTVFPSNSTTYTLTARGEGGSKTATATVNVAAPPPPPPVTKPRTGGSLTDRLSTDVQDAFFDYDKSDIREDARAALTRDADALKAIFADFPNSVIVVEGHCDERGSAEYNLGLGDRRAQSAKDFLVQLGVPADKVRTISYGKERPVCTEENESCWQRNRRAHFSSGQ